MTKIALPAGVTLPLGIKDEDTSYRPGVKIDYSKGDHGQLTFYYTERFGWVITTLAISKGKGGRADRSYGINLQSQGVRVGNGPHVLAQFHIYLYEDRLSDLQKYADLYVEGLGKAGSTRDRISSRRMEGSERRAAGQRSWTWDN